MIAAPGSPLATRGAGGPARAARPAAASPPRGPAPAAAASSFGMFVCSGSPAIAEALCNSGLDWVCLDAQHGAVDYSRLHDLLAATTNRPAARPTKRIVRVGGPDDQYGMQQALDLGADGLMVPLVKTPDDAARAVSFCKYPPQGSRSVAYPVRAVYSKGVGPPALARYLQDANKETEVWIQVETKECFEAIDDVLAVPGIHCAFLGPADLGFAHGLHEKFNHDLAAMLSSPEMARFHTGVASACARAGVEAGAFCLGRERAAALAGMGFNYVAFDTDLGALINYAGGVVGALRPSSFS